MPRKPYRGACAWRHESRIASQRTGDQAMAVIRTVVLAAFALLAGCEKATLPLKAGTGPEPTLPPPAHTLLPTVHIAPAKGWAEGAKPTAAAGLAVAAYATGLDHPRWL